MILSTHGCASLLIDSFQNPTGAPINIMKGKKMKTDGYDNIEVARELLNIIN